MTSVFVHTRSWRSRRGNAIIEFGLAFPMLFIFLSGMFQLGYAFFIYNELQSVVRAGARYASTADFDSTASGLVFKNNVARMVTYGTPAGGTTPLVIGLTTSAVDVTWQADSKGIPQIVTVKISSYTLSLLGTSFQLVNKPRATFIYLGQFLG